jgi:hypothetical protein
MKPIFMLRTKAEPTCMLTNSLGSPQMYLYLESGKLSEILTKR